MADIFSWFLAAGVKFFSFAVVGTLVGLIVGLSVWMKDASKWDEKATVSVMWALLVAAVFSGFVTYGMGFWSSAGLITGASFWGFFSKNIWSFFFEKGTSSL